MPPHPDGRHRQERDQDRYQHDDRDDAEQQAADDGTGDRARRHGENEADVVAQNHEARVLALAAKATSMVGSDTRRDRVPATLMSRPNSSTTVGMISSPPRDPHDGGDDADSESCDSSRRDAGSAAEAKGPQRDEMRDGQGARNKKEQRREDAVEIGRPHPRSPARTQPSSTRLPASRLTATGRCGATSDHDTPSRRAGSAVTTTIRLMALFRMTAWSTAKQQHESAPPSPISPPSTTMAAPAAKAHHNEPAHRWAVSCGGGPDCAECPSKARSHRSDD